MCFIYFCVMFNNQGHKIDILLFFNPLPSNKGCKNKHFTETGEFSYFSPISALLDKARVAESTLACTGKVLIHLLPTSCLSPAPHLPNNSWEVGWLAAIQLKCLLKHLVRNSPGIMMLQLLLNRREQRAEKTSATDLQTCEGLAI